MDVSVLRLRPETRKGASSMRNFILIFSGIVMALTLVAPLSLAQSNPPVISSERQAARKELGQLYVEYSADSFVKQAAEGDTIAVKLFLAAGMNPNARSKEGQVALVNAAASGQLETVQVLLAGGVDVNIKGSAPGNQEHTALTAASWYGHNE